MVTATASFFIPRAGHRGYVMYGSGLVSDFFNTQEAALEAIGSAYFIGELTSEEYSQLEQVIKKSSLPLAGSSKTFSKTALYGR